MSGRPLREQDYQNRCRTQSSRAGSRGSPKNPSGPPRRPQERDKPLLKRRPVASLTFPHRQDAPSRHRQQFGGATISVLSSRNLRTPVLDIALRGPPRYPACMSVPVAPMDLDRSPTAAKNYVWRARQVSDVEPKTITQVMEKAAHVQLGRCVFGAYTAHHRRSLSGGDPIGHALTKALGAPRAIPCRSGSKSKSCVPYLFLPLPPPPYAYSASAGELRLRVQHSTAALFPNLAGPARVRAGGLNSRVWFAGLQMTRRRSARPGRLRSLSGAICGSRRRWRGRSAGSGRGEGPASSKSPSA